MRLVSVVVPRLADGDDQRVGHVVAQLEARELGGGDGLDAQLVARERRARTAARLWPATAAVPWPITSDPPDAAVAQARAAASSGSVSGPSATSQLAVALDELAAQGLAERRRRLGDLLQQEVGEVAAVDVAGGDLGVLAARRRDTGSGVPS